MKIGTFHIEPGAFLAPMAGITNSPFRRLCRQMGAAFSVTELVSSHALFFLANKPSLKNKVLGRKTQALVDRFPGESPLAVQIFGHDPEKMAMAARYVEAEGAEIVDLNFGCPAKKIVKGGEGAGVALMRDPEKLELVARAVVQAVSVPVTAKIRLGWSRDEMNAPEVAKRLEDSGVQAVCVHARTREQVHSGPVDLDVLKAVCEAVSIPVIGNGGIHSLADAEEMMARTGCRRVAVGQAAKGNPWIFEELRGGNGDPDMAERVEVCKRHLALYMEWAGERRAVVEMRKHACWYVRGFSNAAAFRKRLAEANDEAGFMRLLEEVPV